MLSRHLFSVSSMAVILLSLAGCASYKARKLPRLSMEHHVSQGNEQDTLKFSYHVFTKKDCRKYLDRDVIRAGYQPIHVMITNNSNEIVFFERKNISLPTVDVYEVAKEVHTNTAARATGFGIASLFIWPFFIPAIVDGMGSSRANEKLDTDFESKLLSDQIIYPHQTIDGLIFVPRELYSSDFQIMCMTTSSQPIILSSKRAHSTAC